MAVRLTEGCFARVHGGERVPGPIVQVVDIKQIAAQQSAEERYRVVLSDGRHTQQALLATQCNELVKQGRLKTHAVVRLVEYMLSDVQQRKVVIVAKLDIVQQLDARIGNPTSVAASATAAGPVMTALAPQVAGTPLKVAALASSRPAATTPVASAASTAVQQQQQQQQQQAGNAPGEDLAQLPIHPIKALNPYQNRWCVRARVTAKSAMKEYNNARGPGKLFSVDLIDSAGDEIRATAFNEQAERFFGMLQPGQCYLISRGTLKVANRKFTNIAHEYEITFNNATAIQACADEASIPHAHYAFVTIDEIAKREADEVVDVLGVVTNVGELGSFTQRATGNQLPKRVLTIVDTSSHSIELTLWAERAQLEIPVGTVIAVRGCKISNFNTKSIGTSSSSTVEIAPDIDEAHKLRGWYDAQGGQLTIYPVSQYSGPGGMGGGGGGGAGAGAGAGGAGEREERFLPLGTVHDEHLGMSMDAEFFNAVGVVSLIKHDNKISYQACPKCGSKVTQGADGMYYCAKCNQTHAECSERYILSMTAADATGTLWLSLFNDHAQQLLGMSASDLLARRTPGNEKEFERAFFDATWRWYTFRVRARMEQYREENRQKCTVVRLAPLDFVAESKRLLQVIASYQQ